MKKNWFFKKLNLKLRVEVIMNISFLMLAAILLIGFTISKINERHILQEKIRYGERMIQDFQTIMDFIYRDKKKFTLDPPPVREEVQDFVRLYVKEKAFYEPDCQQEGRTGPSAFRRSILEKGHTNR
jgi:hypothetical protein